MKAKHIGFTDRQIDFMKGIGISLDFCKQLSGDDYASIENQISIHLQKNGFDNNYAPTEHGKLCEEILDLIGTR